ncbi:MAG: zinc-ribbon domain-containing protein [Firmicutes bacterium]|nr:zinc-ribbon domain-containing protein [Bacillota bacterium]
MVFCVECGQLLNDDMKFCPQCGKKRDIVEDVEQVATDSRAIVEEYSFGMPTGRTQTENEVEEKSGNAPSFLSIAKALIAKEYEFTCSRCGNKWYATQKDIDQSKKTKQGIRLAKMEKFGFHTTKTHRNLQTQISQMQAGLNDPCQCPSCGSRSVTKKPASL